MTPIKPFASLTSALLARKGFARPAMRSPLHDSRNGGTTDASWLDDLGWNDLGVDLAPERPDISPVSAHGEAADRDAAAQAKPNVVLQREAMARLICVPPGSRRPRGTALREGRRAAFTLRLDADQHVAMRLACSLTDQSAQNLLVDALDRLLATMPEVARLAAQLPPIGPHEGGNVP